MTKTIDELITYSVTDAAISLCVDENQSICSDCLGKLQQVLIKAKDGAK